MRIFLLMLALALAPVAEAATLQVGPTRTYTLPCAAIMAAASGDTIEIDGADGSGNQLVYVDDFCTWSTTNLTIRGVGSQRPHVRHDYAQMPGSQGMWRPTHTYGTVTTLTVDSIEMSGAHATNAQPIWPANTSMVLTNVYFHHNDNGILTFNENVAGASRMYDMTITGSEFFANGGSTNAQNNDGHAHNIYIGEIRNFTMTGSWSHDSMKGQDVKSRANTTTLLYNRLGDWPGLLQVKYPLAAPRMLWTGQSNYEIDYSLGGTLIIVGNLIIQSCSSPNKIMLAYHSEDPDAGQANSAEEMYVTNNTFVDICEGTTTNFIRTNKVNPTIQVIQNNIFAGAAAGSMIWATGSGSGVAQTDPANNQKYATVAAANFVDATNQNYHLTGSSTAIDAATVDPAAVYGVSLIPDKYYVHPRSTATRTTTGVRRDLGAYESNASLTGTVPAPVAYALPTATTIVLSWPPPITDTDITQYRVLRNAAALATVTNAYTYTDSTAAADTTYSYTVIADHAGGSSAASAPVVSHRIKQVSGTLAPDLGWQEILNTTLNTVINPATSNFDVFYHTALTLDTQSNRILIWGNGQTRPDNSVYALNMNTLTVAQLNTPQSGTCTAGTLTSGVGTGRPCGRQTRDSLAWLSNVNKMFGWGGYVGGFQTDTWLWTPGTDTWEKKTPTGTAPPSADYPFSTYDPVSQKALVLDKACLTFYDPLTDAWSRGAAGCVVSSGAVVNGAVDPIRHRLYTFGAFTGYFDLDTGSFTALPANNNCTPLIDTDPGLVWEAQLGKMVGWIGGDTIYLLDPVTNTCTTQEIAAGPGYAENTLAAFNVGKRLQYHPPTGTLIAFTDTDRNAFALRLSTVTTGANQQTGGGRRAGGGQEK